VFISGMAEDLATWKDMQPAATEISTTFMYDRPGLGRSEPTPAARDARTMAVELRALLREANVQPPFVIVGHSLGAWIGGVFAHQYSKEIAGMVLVDPAYRETRLRAALSETDWTIREKALLQYATAMSDAQRREKAALEVSGDQAFGAFPMPAVPVVLLSGTKINAAFPSSSVERDVKLKDHREWAARAGRIEHLIVDHARHYIQNEAPEDVIAAIESVVARARQMKR
jgi:pimeloyl-ACP methyl ester carboxylesterase